MELELKKTSLEAYEICAEVTLSQEETAETIVPDYCPDIARIIETEGKIFLHSREVRNGKAELSGTVRVCVLYIPEGEGGIRTLEFAIPFTAESDNRGLHHCQYLAAEVEIEGLETRMLNPRKVFTHCRLALYLTGYRRTALELCSDVDCEEALHVEKRQEHQHTILLTGITEKDFTFTEELALSSGREGASELLCSRVHSTVTETKLVGSKLIFKGVFTLTLLYRNQQGRCCSTTAELPFSQIMEVESGTESLTAQLKLQLTGMDLQIDGDDPEGRQIDVSLYFHVTALLRQEQDLMLLSDLYSTAYEVSYDASPAEFTCRSETLVRRQTVRELLEIGAAADSVLSAHAACGAVQVIRDGGLVTLRTGVHVAVLYLDEGGVPLVAQRQLTVNCQLELPEYERITGKAFCCEEIQTTLGDRGIEVRFPVDFCVEAAARTKKVCISAVKLDTEKTKCSAGTPSLVLRCLGKDERPWDLAKACNTTIADILSANQLEREEDIPTDRLLLIPRKRI